MEIGSLGHPQLHSNCGLPELNVSKTKEKRKKNPWSETQSGPDFFPWGFDAFSGTFGGHSS